MSLKIKFLTVMKRNIILLSTALTLVIIGVLGSTVFRNDISSLLKAALKNEQANADRDEEREEAAAEIGTQEYWKQREQMLRNPLTGTIPDNIREEELQFARRLPRVEDLAGKHGSRLQSLNWSPRGPFNVGGRIRAFAIDADNESTLFAGGASGGIWRSTDAGASWTRRTSVNDLQSITCVAQDRRPGKRNVWYYGTGERIGGRNPNSGGSYIGDGIFKSTDGGLTWAILPSISRKTPHSFTTDFNFVHNIAVDSTQSADVVFAATWGGIYRSDDGGGTWKAALGGGNNESQFSDVVITRTGVVYAAVGTNFGGDNPVKGVFRSTDGGLNWANITPQGWTTGVVNRISIGLSSSNQNVLYIMANTPGSGLQIGTESHSLWKYTYSSGDGSGAGGNWQDRSANIPRLQPEGGVTGNYTSQNSYNLFVRVKPDNENVVFLGGVDLFRSTDGFATATNTQRIAGYEPSGMSYADFPNQHPDHNELVFLPSNPNTAYNLNDGGVHRTSNVMAAPEEIPWQKLNNGIVVSQFYAIAVDNGIAGDGAIVGGLQDRGTFASATAAPGDIWREVAGADGGYCAIGDNKNGMYVSFQNGPIFKVIGNRIVKMDPNGGKGYLFINPYILDPNNSTIMYNAGGVDLWRHDDLSIVQLGTSHSPSYDRVQGWTRAADVITAGQISSFGASRGGTGGTRLYVGTSLGQILRVDNAQIGTMTPSNVTSADFPKNAFVASIDVDPANPDRAVAVFSNYGIQPVWYTTDGGATWAPITGNLRANPNGTGAGPSVQSVAIQAFGGTTRYFLGTSTGVYSTTQLAGGNTVWAQEGATVIGNTTVGMVVARQRDGLVAVGTYGCGIFSAQSTPAAQAFAQQTPNSTGESLVETGAAYPNPVVSETSIPYTLQRAATVRVQVTDASGRIVAEPFSGKQGAGSHTARWDGYKRTNASSADVAQSGVYFFQVMATDENGVMVRRSGQVSVQR
jgi:hypothetical protein